MTNLLKASIKEREAFYSLNKQVNLFTPRIIGVYSGKDKVCELSSESGTFQPAKLWGVTVIEKVPSKEYYERNTYLSDCFTSREDAEKYIAELTGVSL